MTYDEGWDRIHGTQDDERRCQKCGCPTKGEEAWVDGQIWCHPCADEPREALRPGHHRGTRIPSWN